MKKYKINSGIFGDFVYTEENNSFSITRYIGGAVGGNITVPHEIDKRAVTSIWSYAFANCKTLVSVSLPNSITSILEQTFLECSNLKYIYIPDSVTSIGCEAFKDCESLEEIFLPTSLVSIGSRAFDGCSSLKKIIIPETVIDFGDDIFIFCGENSDGYFHLYGKKGSEAENYANMHEYIKFIE